MDNTLPAFSCLSLGTSSTQVPSNEIVVLTGLPERVTTWGMAQARGKRR